MEPKVLEDDEIEIDFKEIWYAIKSKLFIIMAIGLLMGCLACAFTKFFIKPVYTSTSSMLILATQDTTQVSLSDLQMGSQLTNDYSELIVSSSVLDQVIENLNLDTNYKKLKNDISIGNPDNTRILNISVENHDAELAAAIVNEITDVASDFIGDIMEVAPPKIIKEGEIPTVRTKPSIVKNTLFGLIAGIFVTCGVLIVRVILDDTIKSEEDIEKYLGIPTLACVPDRQDYINSPGKKKKKRKRK